MRTVLMAALVSAVLARSGCILWDTRCTQARQEDCWP
jgi:hypothetical protein